MAVNVELKMALPFPTGTPDVQLLASVILLSVPVHVVSEAWIAIDSELNPITDNNVSFFNKFMMNLLYIVGLNFKYC